MTSLDQHQVEIQGNLRAWENKPLLRTIYAEFYRRILALIDETKSGLVVEIGSGIGNLKQHLSRALCTDLFANPWLDLVCDGYELPFRGGSVSHLVLFDVFHHLQAPRAFLKEARRVLTPGGRLILFEPFISWSSHVAYSLFHHEPVGWREPIDPSEKSGRPRRYYAAQGNATRLLFRQEHLDWLAGWTVAYAEAFSAFAYLLSGGYSRPNLYPPACLRLFQKLDAVLSRWPRLFGARCLIALTPAV
jgi:SAM-dependent methyltransferase